jgi:hypothetical protein
MKLDSSLREPADFSYVRRKKNEKDRTRLRGGKKAIENIETPPHQ